MRDARREIRGRTLARRRQARAHGPATAWVGRLLPGTPASGASALTPEGAALTIGYGNDVAVYGVALNWNLPRPVFETDENVVGLRLVGQAAYWHGQQHPTPKAHSGISA